MKTSLLVFLHFQLLLITIGPNLAQPVNDEIATALQIRSFPFTDPGVVFTQADTEGPVPASDGPCHHYEPMVWYKFRTQSAGTVVVTSGVNSYVVAVYYTAANLNATSTADLIPVTPCRGSTAGVGANLVANQDYYVVVASATDIDVLFNGSALLPVSYNEITAKQVEQGIKLSWNTNTEFENLGFTVERLHKEGWREIAFVAGAGTNENTQYYSYLDRHPLEGENNYRLENVDFDGSTAHSPIVSAFYQGQEVDIFPSPVDDRINIVAPGAFEARLFTANGQLIDAIQSTASQGIMPTGKLSSGTYYLTIKGQDFYYTHKVIKPSH